MDKDQEALRDNYVVELRDDQWELIVMCLDRVRSLTIGESTYLVDKLGREFLRRRCVETIGAITNTTGIKP